MNISCFPTWYRDEILNCFSDDIKQDIESDDTKQKDTDTPCYFVDSNEEELVGISVSQISGYMEIN